MGHESSICGYIKFSEDVDTALKEIRKLPASSADDTSPYLTSNMFSHTQSPEYRETMIHFAASYKDILGNWVEWETKFELLLEKFSFDEVKILIDDCYRGNFIAIWSNTKYKAGKRTSFKSKKYLNLRYEPEIEF